ncbi:MAG: ATP-binding protein [Prevotellaceae bacterium]|jgi:AAA+ ATPase superfamily predicted ATPase|nr:ATP-binding protein [Prevotellaceae bacterium]
MRNPFLIRGYVSPEYFCDRKTETEEIVRKLTNENSLLLMSQRRMGKTGLIDHCFYQTELKKNYHLFYVDIYATTNLQEFVYKFGKEIFDKIKPKGKKFLENFISIITSLRPAFKFDEQSGAPIFDIGIGDIKSPEFSIEEIFKFLQNADKHCIIAIDEFQQIGKYPQSNIEAILRTHIQKATNCTFLFAGSQQHLLRNIFFTASRPFYQSVSVLSLNPIDKKTYTSFIIKQFKKNKKYISTEFVERIYDKFEGHTFYIQSVFNELFALLDENEECTENILVDAVNQKVKSYENIFLDTLNLLSNKQKEVLYAIAKAGKANSITSADFIRKYALKSASSVQSAAKQLLELEIVTAENNVYQVYDRFFGLWLTTQYGNGFTI